MNKSGEIVGLAEKIWNIIENIVHSILLWIFSLFHKDLDENLLKAVIQFIKFGIVGLSNTIISYVLYAGCLYLFRKINVFTGTDYLIAQIIAFILSVLWSFYWNNKYVFQEEEGERVWWKALIKTYISYSFTGLFLNSILLVLWIEVLGVSEYLAPIFNLIISVPINFIINKFWAFNAKNTGLRNLH